MDEKKETLRLHKDASEQQSAEPEFNAYLQHTDAVRHGVAHSGRTEANEGRPCQSLHLRIGLRNVSIQCVVRQEPRIVPHLHTQKERGSIQKNEQGVQRKAIANRNEL